MNKTPVNTRSSAFTLLAALCCYIACLGDFAVTFMIGFFVKGYDFLNKTESFLGTEKSPVAIYMNTWGMLFSILFVIYAWALRQSIFAKGKWQTAAFWCIVIYGLGEGAGSSLFPINYHGDQLTLSAKLHIIFSAIGDIGLVVLPFLLLKIFPKASHYRLHRFTCWVAYSGPVLVIIFLMAKAGWLPLKGLWQRVYLLDYYSLLVVLSSAMLLKMQKAER